MLQYLLNATAIWLISLAMFDVLLRRESYHGYNRFYLLFTFLLGALLPLWQWQDEPTYAAALQRPVERVISAKETIVDVASSTTSFSWELYLRYAYTAGVFVSLLLLLAEVVKLIRLYRAGNRYREGSCMIIETGKDYSPFSIFNYVFVSNRAKYNDEEWKTIIAHEQMHGLLFHFIDVLMMQLARVVFWFHPLVYVYQKRLMMQHEYQADKAGKAQPQFYGKFLIEQALLQNAPSVTHSFNRSPIKNRIVMLTRKSTAAARTKTLVFIPLALVCVACFTKSAFSQKFVKNGNVVTYRGNRFEMSDTRTDTISMTDPVSGKEIMQVATRNAIPVKVNNEKIYNSDEVTSRAASFSANGSLEDYLFKHLATELDKLPDGTYVLDLYNIVLDSKGRIVFYEYNGITNYDNKGTIPAEIMKAIDKKIDPALYGAPAMKPAKIDGKGVYALTDILLSLYKVEVKNHRSSHRKAY